MIEIIMSTYICIVLDIAQSRAGADDFTPHIAIAKLQKLNTKKIETQINIALKSQSSNKNNPFSNINQNKD